MSSSKAGATSRPLAATLRELTVHDAMWPGIITCPPTASAGEVASIMSSNHIHCVIVSDLGEAGGTGQRWDVVSDLDLVSVGGRDIDDLTAAEITATEPLTIDAGESLERACQVMSEHAVTHVLALEPGSSIPVGVLSTRDVARVLSQAAAPS